MKPQKALELVNRYSFLTRAIGGCKARIGDCLDQCRGKKGFRLEVEHHPAQSLGGFFGDSDAYDCPTQRASNDQATHLEGWYEKPGKSCGEDEWDEYMTFVIGQEQQEECAACFAAHEIVQERKQLRRQLAAVKGAMTKATAGMPPTTA